MLVAGGKFQVTIFHCINLKIRKQMQVKSNRDLVYIEAQTSCTILFMIIIVIMDPCSFFGSNMKFIQSLDFYWF